MKRLALFTAVMLGSTAIASAADIYAPPPVDEVVYTAPAVNFFHGPYIGLHGGWAWGDASAEYVDDIPCPIGFGFGTFPCPADLDPDGAFVGGQIGWNWVFGSGLMIGIEGDYSFASLHDSAEVGTGIFATDVDFEVDQMATIQARFGWVMGRWMPFVTGGWGWAHAERSTFNVLAGGLGAGDFSDSNWHQGWTAGAGLEFAINKHWTVKGEYRYFDGSEETYDNIIPVDVDLNIHSVRFGVNFGF